MPFVPIGEVPKKLNSAAEAPIFLFPGVIGYADLHVLAFRLKELNPNRPILLWQHPSYQSEAQTNPQTKALFANDFTSYVNAIRDEMFRILPPSLGLPYFTFGYSFGGAIAEAVAHAIKSHNEKNIAHAGTIDTAAIELLQSLYSSKTTDATKKLIDIINIAAQLAGLNQREFKDEKEISDISKYPLTVHPNQTPRPISQVTFILALIQQSNYGQPIGIGKLYQLTGVIEHHLNLLSNATFRPTTKVDSLCSWSTEGTRTQHQAKIGGRTTYRHNLNREKQCQSFTAKTIKDANHFSCVDADHALSLAKSITSIVELRAPSTHLQRQTSNDGMRDAFRTTGLFVDTSSPKSDSSSSSNESSPDNSPNPHQRSLPKKINRLKKMSVSSNSDDLANETKDVEMEPVKSTVASEYANTGPRISLFGNRSSISTRSQTKQQANRLSISPQREEPAEYNGSASMVF